MTIEFLDNKKENPSHIVRVLLPLGVYPDETVTTDDSKLLRVSNLNTIFIF